MRAPTKASLVTANAELRADLLDARADLDHVRDIHESIRRTAEASHLRHVIERVSEVRQAMAGEHREAVKEVWEMARWLIAIGTVAGFIAGGVLWPF